MDYRNNMPVSGASLEQDDMDRKRKAMAQMLANGGQGGGGSTMGMIAQIANGAAQGYANKRRAEARLLQNQIATANTTNAPLDSLIQQRNSWQSTPTASAVPVAQTAAMYGPQSPNGAP